MPRLFTYTIPVDDGAAPNPYWGICTLAICKPVIRRTAKVGDWVVGTGSKKAPSGDLSNHVVYAMEVSAVMTLEQYDEWTRNHSPNKIPDVTHSDRRRRLGDSIYDYSSTPMQQRQGVHNLGNIATDLGGKNALLSLNFHYFGREPIPLPDHLLPIVHQTQGHKVNANKNYVDPFIEWVGGLMLPRNVILAEPDHSNSAPCDDVNSACARRLGCALEDEQASAC